MRTKLWHLKFTCSGKIFRRSYPYLKLKYLVMNESVLLCLSAVCLNGQCLNEEIQTDNYYNKREQMEIFYIC